MKEVPRRGARPTEGFTSLTLAHCMSGKRQIFNNWHRNDILSEVSPSLVVGHHLRNLAGEARGADTIEGRIYDLRSFRVFQRLDGGPEANQYLSSCEYLPPRPVALEFSTVASSAPPP